MGFTFCLTLSEVLDVRISERVILASGLDFTQCCQVVFSVLYFIRRCVMHSERHLGLLARDVCGCLLNSSANCKGRLLKHYSGL